MLLIDDGGVISDNERRGAQWRALVAAFFAPRLGGTPDAWAAANRAVAAHLLVPAAWEARLRAAPDYATYERDYYRDWLGGMCARVGVPLPPDGDAVAREATAYITRRVRADFPGAVAAIRALHAAGYTLHTASGESSTDLTGYLEGLGVRACFGRLFGPDLVAAFKAGPEYYARICADLDLAPADALVVDDSPAALGWAAAVGARTVLVGAAPLSAGDPTLRIPNLGTLPELLAGLAAGRNE